MDTIKKRKLKSISSGISAFESKKNVVKNADFSDFKTFLNTFLNTSEPKQRKKLAEEFKKRHSELYEFLKSNPELISAENEIERIVNFAEISEKNDVTNLLEKIEESLK